jgi:hypothetical protein
MNKKDTSKLKEGYQDKISKQELAASMREYFSEASDEEMLSIWKIIAKTDPTIALKAILSKKEHLDLEDL